MGQASNINEPANSNKRTNRLTTLAFFEIGIFEIIFVITLLLIIFGTLNYFNILPVSETFPKYLGWLPSQRAGDIYRNKTNNQAYNDFLKQYYASRKEVPSGTSRPTPTPFVRFSYDASKAQKTLEDYITDNIKQEFLPAKLNIKQNLISSGELQGTDYLFGTNWTLNDIVFNGSFHYLKDTNDFRDMELYADISKTTGASINSTNSAILVNTYLKNIPIPAPFDCGIFKEITQFCEYFAVNNTGKSGFGAVESKDEANKKVILVFSCFIPKNDQYYPKRTSCLLFREKDPSGL